MRGQLWMKIIIDNEKGRGQKEGGEENRGGVIWVLRSVEYKKYRGQGWFGRAGGRLLSSMQCSGRGRGDRSQGRGGPTSIFRCAMRYHTRDFSECRMAPQCATWWSVTSRTCCKTAWDSHASGSLFASNSLNHYFTSNLISLNKFCKKIGLFSLSPTTFRTHLFIQRRGKNELCQNRSTTIYLFHNISLVDPRPNQSSLFHLFASIYYYIKVTMFIYLFI